MLTEHDTTTVHGASGRAYTLRCRREGGRAQWYVCGNRTSWGAHFLGESQARAWAQRH